MASCAVWKLSVSVGGLGSELDVSRDRPHAASLLIGPLRDHSVVHEIVLAAESVSVVFVQGEGVSLVLVVPCIRVVVRLSELDP